MANGTPAALRTRRDVWKLPAGDSTLDWYAQAIAQLQARPISDPTSWRYQAAIHDYDTAADPLRTSQDRPPPNRSQFWRQCQHGCGFFLPWHRMYLHYFEQLIAATVVGLGGPAGWSLPYWNYSDTANPNARRLPPAFYAAKTASGASNPLLVAQRAPGANTGGEIADELDVDLSCLNEDAFFGAGNGESGGFGGLNTKNPVHSGQQTGGLEAVPHGSMHVAIGGTGPNAGWMSSFNTAPLDPLFWLHHSNIDRLWQVWLGRDHAHLNPTDNGWLNQAFEFHDSTGAAASLVPRDVLDTTTALLGYQYEDVSDPLAGP